MNYRLMALLAGLAAFLVSVVSLVYPGVLVLELERVLVWMVGLFAILLGLRTVQLRRRQSLDEAETPNPEVPVAVSPPGDDLDDVFTQFLGARRVHGTRNRAKTALNEAAVSTLRQYAGYSRAAAEAAVEAGSWTDDPYAVSFLGGPDSPPLPLRSRLAAIIDGESAFRRSIRHTVDEIAAVAGLHPEVEGQGERTESGSRTGSTVTGPSARSGVEGGGSQTAAERPAEPDGGSTAVVSRRTQATGHWRGVIVVALIGIGVGVLVEEPAVLLAGVIGIGFAAYARSTPFPPDEVSIERELSTHRVEPGETVEVSMTITNETDGLLPDLRLIDGVPDALAVESGSPRLGTALRPGESATTAYTLSARRGVHDFGETTVLARDLAGAIEQRVSMAASSTLTCVPSHRSLTEPVPLREQATQYVGQLETDIGGEGVEFFATRDYRPGDAKRHIDWKRHARTGELTTIMFREERTATVVLVVDSRAHSYVSPTTDGAHAVDRLVDAAGMLYQSLTQSGNLVGISAVDSETCWIRPGSGTEHGLRVREELGTNPALSPVPPSGHRWVNPRVTRLRKRLESGTQVVFLSPLADVYAGRIPRQLDENGFPVTVISPNACADRTPGHRLARVARTLRISSLRSAGIPVIDWPWADNLDEVVARYQERRHG